ncbi:hypothetical protein [Fictibacillus enclensis]|uniref:hypothetical protein n=1 Tax=Fictibacillus enclensis TaxID=1017270 RepID=UPI0024BF6104|nr:hypothetical protein [Fictibacillus enclensis]WHY70566.1 hypothetical protein QNH15_16065 [Fictibacillus enclensis]
MKKKIAGLVLSSALLASTLGVSSAHAASAPTYSDTKQELKVAVKNSGHHTERISHPLFTTKAKSQAMKMLKAGDIYYENEPNNDLSSADLLTESMWLVPFTIMISISLDLILKHPGTFLQQHFRLITPIPSWTLDMA